MFVIWLTVYSLLSIIAASFICSSIVYYFKIKNLRKSLQSLEGSRNTSTTPETVPTVTKSVGIKEDSRIVKRRSTPTKYASFNTSTKSYKERKRRYIEREGDRIQRDIFVHDLLKVADFGINYLANVKTFHVLPDIKHGYLFEMLPKKPPDLPSGLGSIVKDLDELIVPNMAHWKHPNFVRPEHIRSTLASTVGLVMSSTIGTQGSTWDASPAIEELETAMMSWAENSLGLPTVFHSDDESLSAGFIMNSVSETIYSAMMAARNLKAYELSLTSDSSLTTPKILKKYGSMYRKNLSKMVVYCSRDADPSIFKMGKYAMLRVRRFYPVVEEDYGISPFEVEKRIQRDIKKGFIPCCIIVTLGTRHLLASDNLESFGYMCRKYNCWLHVDASSIGSFWIEPQLRNAHAHLYYADSLTVELGYHAHDVVIVWAKNQRVFRKGILLEPDILPSPNFNMNPQKWDFNYCNSFKALKVWTNYRLIGLTAMRKHVNNLVSMANQLADLMATHPNFRVVRKSYSSVFFQYTEPEMSYQVMSKNSVRLAHYLRETRMFSIKRTKMIESNLVCLTISSQPLPSDDVTKIWTDLKSFVENFRDKIVDQIPTSIMSSTDQCTSTSVC